LRVVGLFLTPRVIRGPASAAAVIPIGISCADALNATSAAAHQTNYAYDGFDRLVTTTYADNTTDQVTSYVSDGNALTHVNRAGQSLNHTFDNLDRMATKVVPAVPAQAAATAAPGRPRQRPCSTSILIGVCSVRLLRLVVVADVFILSP
jgi:YD repeat-containing protein